MRIAVIGAGNVGGALAVNWAKAGHDVIIGARDPNSDKVKKVISQNGLIKVKSVEEAAREAEIILIAANPASAVDIAKQLNDAEEKIIIDAMNSISSKPEGFNNTFEALKHITKCESVVKCFNSTGFENMYDPRYGDVSADMFMAGSSQKGKSAARTLSLAAGFAECYDFGGDDKVGLLEQFAMVWINLAIIQKQGRNIAFKVLKR